MYRRSSLLILLTVLIVLASTYLVVAINQRPGLPFSVNIVDAHTAVVEPIPGVPWPLALRPGDKVDLAALPRASRIAIRLVNNLSALPLRRTYTFTVRRDAAVVTIPVKTARWNATSSTWPLYWITRVVGLLLTAIALLTLWRGRDRAAAGLALWAVTFVAAYDAAFIPSDGAVGLGLLMGEIVLILLARIGFYVMAESMLGSNLGGRAQAWWRASFLLLLVLGAVQAVGGSIIFVVTGWAELVRPEFGIALTAPYLVPVALLFAGYRRAPPVRKLRLRWMLGSSVVLLGGVNK